ncbi:MAG: META domain-containing protein [Rhizobiales bacterium]|nr:META domain-containing protein [Hyphomicrobiales bacterium]
MIVACFRTVLAGMILLAASGGFAPARAAEEFPFGLEMTLDAPPQPGSKRIPNLEIGDRGEVRLELWCKGGVGQFSVAGNTVIFVPGAMDNRTCSPAQVQMDDALLAELADASTWARKGDYVTFTGRTSLRFHLNTN